MLLYGCGDNEFKGKSIAPREIEINGIQIPLKVEKFSGVMKEKYSETDFTIEGVAPSVWARHLIQGGEVGVTAIDENVEEIEFFFDWANFELLSHQLRTTYPEITCNDTGLKKVCALDGKSSKLYISTFLDSGGKPQSTLTLTSHSLNSLREANHSKDEVYKWAFTIILALVFGFILYRGWVRFFGKAGLAARVEAKNARLHAIEAKNIARAATAMDIAEKSKKRITERLKTKISHGELEEAVAQEFKLIDRNFDENSLSLLDVNQITSNEFQLKIIEVSVTPIEDDYLISVRYSSDFSTDHETNRHEKIGYLAIQSILFLVFWIFYGILSAFIVLIGGLAIRAIMNIAFPRKQKNNEIESQIERCLKNLKNEYSTT